MDLHQARAFLTVSQEKSLKKAADRLLISPGRVSQIVRELERDLGCTLLDRSNRTARLTPNGQKFVQDFSPLVLQFEKAESEFRRHTQTGKNTLRLGFITSTGFNLVPNFIKQISNEHPGFEVIPRSFSYSVEIEQGLSNGVIDLGIIRTIGPPEMFESKVLRIDPLVLCTPADKKKPIPANLESLLKHELLLTYPPTVHSVVGVQITNFLRENVKGNVRRLAVTDTVSMLGLVSAGGGVAILPKSSMEIGIPNVNFSDIPHSPTSEISLAWNGENTKQSVVKFVSSLPTAQCEKKKETFVHTSL